MAVKDITLGQYYPGGSIVHRMDPRTKIIGTLVFLVSLFVADSFTAYGFAALCLVICIKLSGVPFGYISKGLKPIMLLIFFTMFINLFMTPGEPIWSFWFLNLTREGIERAAFMAMRLIMLIFGSSLLTLTTKPITLTDGLEKLFSPFKLIGLPAHELAMMMSIALRFIPTLMDETDKIMKAQTARGADFETGNLRERAQSLIPLLVPLFVSAFRIASDLAMAMEARCYRGGEGRTRMNAIRMTGLDAGAFVCYGLYLGAMYYSRSLGLF